MSFCVIRSSVLNVNVFKNFTKCRYATKRGILEELEVEDKPSYFVDTKYSEDEIMRCRNKSRLSSKHENILNGRKPYDQSMEWYHDSVWYRRKMLGQYGIDAVGCSPAIAWPTEEEVEDTKCIERLSYPQSISESLQKINEKKIADAIKIRQREEDISKVVAKFSEWKSALNEKMRKKIKQNMLARQKKQQILEEIREKYGYSISQRDAKVKEFLEEKALAEKKKKKQLSKEKKAEKALEYMKRLEEKELAKSESAGITTTQNDEAEEEKQK